MSSGVVAAPDALGQQELVLLHQSVDAFAVNPRGLSLQPIISYQPPDSRVTVAGLCINCSSNLPKDNRISLGVLGQSAAIHLLHWLTSQANHIAARHTEGLTDRHHIVEKGRVVWVGSSQALAGDKDLQHRYLGV